MPAAPTPERPRNPAVVIPARLASSRLPRKALLPLAGQPMVVHVARAALKAALGPVILAVDGGEMAQALSTPLAELEREGMGAVQLVLTDPALPSGSDRVAAALALVDPEKRHDVVVNVQGDLPLVRPEHIQAGLEALLVGGQAMDIGTLAAPIHHQAEAEAPSVVKVACALGPGRNSARALYFSRAVVPGGHGPLWHHVGLYAWRRPALERFVALPPSTLEKRESLEQLRALEAGMTVGCAAIDEAPWGVDTPDDLVRARLLLEGAGEEEGVL
ncbi:3-deoxy-manno-octulosonate cytidylyltransferase [Formicincola oecophyllae]|uniref:3-deoxy-manno-octulosonate cytidylyltransferase n=2 Tax=Formicincola oecophyllae TaxID=2558361 RepID=A0A4Y6UAL8_9PROT|nr:3-deoxy-manno-octulosonate cytidylyltransferase [Formicincola oecophyllae]